MPRTQRTVAGMATRKQSQIAAPCRGSRDCGNVKVVTLEKIRVVVLGYLYIFVGVRHIGSSHNASCVSC